MLVRLPPRLPHSTPFVNYSTVPVDCLQWLVAQWSTPKKFLVFQTPVSLLPATPGQNSLRVPPCPSVYSLWLPMALLGHVWEPLFGLCNLYHLDKTNPWQVSTCLGSDLHFASARYLVVCLHNNQPFEARGNAISPRRLNNSHWMFHILLLCFQPFSVAASSFSWRSIAPVFPLPGIHWPGDCPHSFVNPPLAPENSLSLLMSRMQPDVLPLAQSDPVTLYKPVTSYPSLTIDLHVCRLAHLRATPLLNFPKQPWLVILIWLWVACFLLMCFPCATWCVAQRISAKISSSP